MQPSRHDNIKSHSHSLTPHPFLLIVSLTYPTSKKLLFSQNKFKTLNNYDANCAPQTLISKEGIRWSIPIFILNIFGYGTHDPIVHSIHLHSQTLVKFKSRKNFQHSSSYQNLQQSISNTIFFGSNTTPLGFDTHNLFQVNHHIFVKIHVFRLIAISWLKYLSLG